MEYDLLIAEVHMSGNEELGLVRAARFYAPNLPVILFTAYPSLSSAITSIQLRVAAYLVKPVEFSTLIQHVRTSIAENRASRCKENLAERSMVYTWAMEEAIQILDDTRSAFKSRRLSGLRRKLERLLASGYTE
jgi:DNA-binding NtrC family response regulator